MRWTSLPLTVALALIALTAETPPALADDKPQWEPLFDGKTLDGWIQRGGKANYRVEDGMIVGSSVPDTPNSFLCTERHFGDFELELEYKVDPRLNSGIQIRSNSFPEYENGRVHGYQVEIDPSDRAWSAGIYDEGRRGWLNSLENNEPARKAFKQNDWNHYRVVAIGDSIKTWINGVPAADLVDSMTLTGFIGLQVHGTKEEEPMLIRWRNLRIKDLGRHEWKPLFDGKMLDAWLPDAWEWKDAVLVATPSDRTDAHHLMILDECLVDFTVRLKFKAPAGGGGLCFGARGEEGVVTFASPERDASAKGLFQAGKDGWIVCTPSGPGDGYEPEEWAELTVSMHSGRMVVHLNGKKTDDLMTDSKKRTGQIACFHARDCRAPVMYRDLEILVPVR